MEANTLAAAQQVDFSLLALFIRATFIVKIVMLILTAASFWSWAIIIQKFINYRAARSETKEFEEDFWSGQPLDTLYDRIGKEPETASEKIFVSGMAEWRRSHSQDGKMIAGA